LRTSDSPPPAPPARPSVRRDGEAELAEVIQSGAWDTERDLVVLVGPAPASAATVLRRLGQQRILWFRAGDESGDEPAGVIRVDDLDEVAAAVRALGALSPERVTGRPLHPAHAPLYDQVLSRIERARRERFLSGEGGAAAARLRIEQGLANLPALCRWPGVSAVGNSLGGVPMVIVAPGPSLARNIDQVAQLRGRAILLALSHSVAPLLAAGVVPDFVLAADAHDVGYHLAGLDLSGVAALIVAATAHPGLFRTAAPRHLVLAEPGPVDDWLFHLTAGGRDAERGCAPLALPSGGSVAHTAMAIGLAWGCDPIGFVGLDLAFPRGECYAPGSPDGAVRPVVSADRRTVSLEGWSDTRRRGRAPASERLVELPGWDGHPLPSSFHFSMCQRWFEETARRLSGGTRLYNCSEGGAYIGGMRHIRLAGLAGRLAPAAGLNPSALAARAIAEVDARARGRAVRERLIDLAVDLRGCQALAGRDVTAVLGSLPLLAALVEADMSAMPAGARGQGADGARRRAALLRWSSWLEPRLVEAERALAREERASDTVCLHQPAVIAELG
jgi:hypothetical protein